MSVVEDRDVELVEVGGVGEDVHGDDARAPDRAKSSDRLAWP